MFIQFIHQHSSDFCEPFHSLFYILITRLLLLPRSSISVHFIGIPVLARLFKTLWILINSSFVLLWIFSSLLHVKLCAKCVGRCVTPLQNHLALHLTKHVQISSWKASLSISWQDIKWAEEIFQLGFIHYWMLITIFLCWISKNKLCVKG